MERVTKETMGDENGSGGDSGLDRVIVRPDRCGHIDYFELMIEVTDFYLRDLRENANGRGSHQDPWGRRDG